MRKKLLVIIVVITMGLSFTNKAEASDRGREFRNILDLTNFKMDFDTLLFNTIEPIDVKVNQVYIIVADKMFIGHNDVVKLEIAYSDNANEVLELVYVTDYFAIGMFTTKGDKIHINNFNFIGVANTNVMLIEGDDSVFEEYYRPYTEKDNYTKGYLEIDYDKPLSVAEIDGYIKSTNPVTGQSVNIIRSRNTYKHQIGSYEALYYSILNDINNVFYLEIKVVDKTAPVIITNQLSYSFTTMPSIDKIIGDIDIIDNVDTIKNENIEVINTNYDPDLGVGSYYVNIMVKDNANNTSEKNIIINIDDSVGPKIIGPNALFVYSTKEPLTEQNILNNFLITDDTSTIDKIKIEIILNDYKMTTDAGKYNVTIRAIDEASNETTREIVIHVIANHQSEYNFDPVIKTNTKNLISEDEIIEAFMKQANMMGINVTDVSVNKDIYELNHGKPGEYMAYVEYLLDGSLKYAEVTILVTNENRSMSPYFFAIPIVVILGGMVVIIKKKKRQSN